jgi:ribosomal-protein-alanine N-acetyltransferase
MIETPRLILRNWRESDRDPFRRMNADPRVMEYFPALLTPEETDTAIARLQAHADRHGFTFWAVELRRTSGFIGFTGLFHTPFEAHFTPCVEIGWRLLPEFWNQGLATEAARAAADYALDHLHLPEIVAFTAVTNQRSRRVMEKLGMTHNPADDFDHPRVPAGNPLHPHVLYRLAKAIART